jgi:hypothetical protein
MLLVDRLLSKNFRRHDTSSKFFCRHKHAEVEELLRVLNFFKFQTIQLLYLGSEGEGDNYKTTSDKVRVKAKIFKLVLELTTFTLLKYSVDKMSCRRNVLSTKCPVDEMFCRRNACRRKFVDKMFRQKFCRRNAFRQKCHPTKDIGFEIFINLIGFIEYLS